MSDLIINEIFHSIQGESSFMGQPCVFVRLTACNLRCTYCDTAYAFYEGKPMKMEEILREVERFGCRLVEVTGGEPLVQAEAPALLKALCDRGYETLLETGGSLDIGPIDPRVHRIVDVKCPGSGMQHRNRWENLELVTRHDDVKFVIGDRQDFDWSVAVVEKYGLIAKTNVFLSPVFGKVEPVDLAGWILASRVPVRMQLQMHKYIWEPTARGV
jgi:7-carboxy-7-deazaguanine synthase